MRRDEIVNLVGHAWMLLGLPREPDADAVVLENDISLHLQSVYVRDSQGRPIAMSWEVAPTEWERLLDSNKERPSTPTPRPSIAPDAAAARTWNVPGASVEIRAERDAFGWERHRTVVLTCQRCGRKVLGAAQTYVDSGPTGHRLDQLEAAVQDVFRRHPCSR